MNLMYLAKSFSAIAAFEGITRGLQRLTITSKYLQTLLTTQTELKIC